MPVLTKINTNSIAEDAITGDKFAGDAYLANTATQNISGTYSENRLYTSDAYTLSGNATVNSNLTLSSVKSTDDVVLTAGGAYTLTGTGVLSGGSVVAKGKTDLSDMSGTLGGVVTGSPNLNLTTGLSNTNTQFPAGHVIQTQWNSYSSQTTHNSDSWTSTGLSVVITPKFSQSKIMVTWSCITFYEHSSSGNLGFGFRIQRLTPDIVNVFGGTNTIGGGYQYAASYLSGNHQGVGQNGGSAIDTPNTLSAVTYQQQVSDASTSHCYSNYGSTPSFLIAQEIFVT